MKNSPFITRLEAILERELSNQMNNIKIVGTSSPVALGMVLSGISSKSINDLPHLVVTSSVLEAARIKSSIEFFDSKRCVEILPHFDVSPYSGLYPKPQAVAERLRFLHSAVHARSGDIFIAPIGSLLQNCLPFDVLNKFSFNLSTDLELPADFFLTLSSMGYQSCPAVEDVGQFSQRGGIVDIFSPTLRAPVRVELFGDTITSMRSFDPETQQSTATVSSFSVIPCRETVFLDQNLDFLLEGFRKNISGRGVDKTDSEELLRSLSRKTSVDGMDFLLPYFYSSLEHPLDMFSSELNIWFLDKIECQKVADQILEELQADFRTSTRQPIRPELSSLFTRFENLKWPKDSIEIDFSSIETVGQNDGKASVVEYKSFQVLDLSSILSSQTPGSELWLSHLQKKLGVWHDENYRILLAVRNRTHAERLRILLERLDWQAEIRDSDDCDWGSWFPEHQTKRKTITIVLRPLPESLRIPEENLVLLRDEDFFGKKVRQSTSSSSEEFQKQARRLSFGDLKVGDCVVHLKHGVGIYEGLRVMSIGGAESEFIQIHYKGNDKLYLPVYRVSQLQKYSASGATTVLDKLGGVGWEKTKVKVRSHLRDIASELLALYAKRSELHRPKFEIDESKFISFESGFPYDETEDQLRAIADVVKDMAGPKPMDRLICGDVGYGKTEVAMRAAFLSAINKRQVAILAPTTILSFQHFETFKKRFAGWPIEIRELNRFVSNVEVKKSLQELKEGKVDIIIGTHRVLSKDVHFKNLGLMIVDEEQKFGVTHKEKIKKMKSEVDTLTLSATPIPRTLNMSLVGIRDLSLINTAPVDRLPTRTFITKWDVETIRKSIQSEIRRGGQVFFIHNRIQSIFGIADELRQIIPEARIKVGHGQMPEDELEKTMIQFFNHEIDVLLCTTIVESGMDIPKANTMFIDQAHMMGLSQLYQLRGRVGRSKQRAYCYLVLPRNRQLDKTAQERLKVIQENTALGSGIRIAQYDLELRGAGNILGEEQSGHINSVGYELYMDLLNEAIHQLRGEPIEEESVDPEINLRIPALIPDTYISDIRMRLSFYKALADVASHDDLEKIEAELKDQFGEPPEPTQNLMGLMLIRSLCKRLGVRDVSAGVKNISLIFTEKTPLKTDVVISLAMRQNKKYSLTPDNRLNIRLNDITWPAVYEELQYLISLI